MSFPSPRLSTLLGLLLGCSDAPADSVDTADRVEFGDTTTVILGCGDGTLDANEECDDGSANSSTEPDACRENCLLPGCGDAVQDAGEGCDDGGTWGGDGCTPDCLMELGTAEVEPNDDPPTATPASSDNFGALPEDDVDCWQIAVPACGALTVTEMFPCAQPLSLSLSDPAGAMLASGAPGLDGCAGVDPVEEPGARWMTEGAWTVCAAAVNEVEVRGYQLQVATGDSASLDAPVMGDDLDTDGVPDSCDPDRDGDGLADASDNCPDVSNGPHTAPLALSADGFVRSWLLAGPFTTGTTTGECRPSDDAFVGEDAVIAPSLLDPAGDLLWTALFMSGDSYDLLEAYGSTPAPREAYALVYLESPVSRAATLAVGADDGLFAWWNGERVLDEAGCQGVNTDQFQATVAVDAGVNTLLLKVRDWGGGWGFIARVLDPDGTPLVDLTPSLDPATGWLPDQTDSDADGVGDVCEPG